MWMAQDLSLRTAVCDDDKSTNPPKTSHLLALDGNLPGGRQDKGLAG